ncbi:glycosyltransferase family 2 protein [Georgenia subflava]|uniref:glycosyltransferase family 2 protein n=1 Tax=Georgenia subflava TaxID=1622177 RepID=UPI00186B0A8E
MSSDIRSVIVAVITYRRPESLARLLDSLLRLETQLVVEVVVIDNDPSRSARTVATTHAIQPVYHVEPKPGIAAARNASIEAAVGRGDAIIFVDDDEEVPPGWVDKLVEAALKYDAAMVAGPVISRFPEATPKWVTRGGFFQRRVRSTGSSDGLPATNNTLVRTDLLLRHAHIRFNESYSFTGGSDSDFFSRLIATSQCRWIWCSDAEVFEHVQVDRVSARWLVRRGIRSGNVLGRLALRSTPKTIVVIKSLGYLLAGLLSLPISLTIAPGWRARTLIAFTRGIGMLGACRGKFVNEYARD